MIIGGIALKPGKHSPTAQKLYDSAAQKIKQIKGKKGHHARKTKG